MSISLEDAKDIICKLLPLVESESAFLTPWPSQYISASDVFDVIRNATDPAITESEFNQIADDAERRSGRTMIYYDSTGAYWEGPDEEHCPDCGSGELQACEEWCDTQRPADEPDPADDSIDSDTGLHH